VCVCVRMNSIVACRFADKREVKRNRLLHSRETARRIRRLEFENLRRGLTSLIFCQHCHRFKGSPQFRVTRLRVSERFCLRAYMLQIYRDISALFARSKEQNVVRLQKVLEHSSILQYGNREGGKCLFDNDNRYLSQ
jgi:hypothetical protein